MNEKALKECKNLSPETCGKHTLHGVVVESGFHHLLLRNVTLTLARRY